LAPVKNRHDCANGLVNAVSLVNILKWTERHPTSQHWTTEAKVRRATTACLRRPSTASSPVSKRVASRLWPHS